MFTRIGEKSIKDKKVEGFEWCTLCQRYEDQYGNPQKDENEEDEEILENDD